MKRHRKAFKVSYTEELVLEWTNRKDSPYASLQKINFKDIVSKKNYSYTKYLDSYEYYLEQNDWLDQEG